MNKFAQHLKKEFLKISLSPAERRHLRLSLEATMKQKKPTTTSIFYSWFKKHRLAVSLSSGVGILGLLFGGISYAAAATLPGDFLYPVKINLNEKVQVILARTPKAKSSVSALLAEKRVSEIKLLADRGDLDSTTDTAMIEKLKENFDKHASEALAFSEEAEKENMSETTAPGPNEARDQETIPMTATSDKTPAIEPPAFISAEKTAAVSSSTRSQVSATIEKQRSLLNEIINQIERASAKEPDDDNSDKKPNRFNL